MRDARIDPYTGAALGAGYLAKFGNPMLPPTHPDGPRKMRDVRMLEEIVAGYLAKFDGEPEPAAPRAEPKPAPIELGFDPVKWAAMPRAERRAVLRRAKPRRQ